MYENKKYLWLDVQTSENPLNEAVLYDHIRNAHSSLVLERKSTTFHVDVQSVLMVTVVN